MRYLRDAPACVAAFGIVPLLVLVLHRGVDIPYWDEWEWTDLVYAAHTHHLTFAQLWQPHNEHRIFIPNMIMLALDQLGGWSTVREQVFSLALIAATQLALWVLIVRTIPAAWRGLVFLVATVLLLGLVQYENLGWGFQIAWLLCNLCLVVAAVFLTRPQRTRFDLALAVLAAAVASLSSSQGVVVWIAGALAILLAGPPLRVRLAIWSVFGVVFTVLARSGTPPPAAGMAGAGAGLGHVVGYALVYLGAPVASSFGTGAAYAAGLAVVMAAAAFGDLALRGTSALRARFGPWLALAVFAIGCAVVTAIGRGGNELTQAMSSRYTSISSLGWIALCACAFIAAASVRARTVAVGVVAVLLCASVAQSVWADPLWRAHAAQLRTARAELRRGDPAGLPLVYPNPSRLVPLMRELSEVHDGVFSGR